MNAPLVELRDMSIAFGGIKAVIRVLDRLGDIFIGIPYNKAIIVKKNHA